MAFCGPRELWGGLYARQLVGWALRPTCFRAEVLGVKPDLPTESPKTLGEHKARPTVSLHLRT